VSDEDRRKHLRADCDGCVALCCVAPGFDVSADFPIQKPAGTACGNLTPGHRCRIHHRLLTEGFRGCVAFDCFGAGQRTTRTFGERTWRTHPAAARPMFEMFGALRLLHEILWYLEEAHDRLPDGMLREEVSALRRQTQKTASGVAAGEVTSVHLTNLQRHAGPLLGQVSGVLRDGAPVAESKRRADLAGRCLRGADLRRTDLRAASLIGADLRQADLRLADLLGTDLRGADLRGANLVDALFLTQAQTQAATGDGSTLLPAVLMRPPHWSIRSS
jgi:Pentapeptide repeats (8 copies)